jgi:uncharacterized protein (TIGR02145 family)
MSKNLNYNVPGSKCFGQDAKDGKVEKFENNKTEYFTITNSEIQGYCEKYGRLYNWPTAMALPNCTYGSGCQDQVQPKHRGICPPGWHIPSDSEWWQLKSFAIADSPPFDRHLKATIGWSGNDNGLDTYGFAALPGGYGHPYYNNDFFGDGGYAYRVQGTSGNLMPSSSEWISSNGWPYMLPALNLSGTGSSDVSSVRCVKD